jgi:mitochondrial cardiolipin hydrolase
MNLAELEDCLRKILADRTVTRNEREALHDRLRDGRPNEHDLEVIRSLAFDIVRQQCLGLEVHEALTALEEVIKTVRPTPHCEECTDVLFSPVDDCASRITHLLRAASRSVDVCVYTITDNRIAERLLALHADGRELRIVTDGSRLREPGSDIQRLCDAGVPVRLGSADYLMHHKFAIIDKRILLTGSYNWTRTAAEVNKENLLITRNRHLLAKFGRAFGQLWTDLAPA